MTVRIDTLPLGPLETNCYVIRDGDACAVVDPGMFPDPLIAMLRAQGATPDRVLLTHGHCDHIAGAGDIREAFPSVRIVCPEADAPMLGDPQKNLSGPFGMPMTAPEADDLLHPGDVVTVGESQWRVLDTAGHTTGGVSYYCESAGAAIVGDTLFACGIGRTDISGGNAELLLRNIREQLLSLPDETRVLPGHGPETTVGVERETNPFLL